MVDLSIRMGYNVADVETNECLDNNGGCWQDKVANLTACKVGLKTYWLLRCLCCYLLKTCPTNWPISYGSTDTSFSHNNGMEGEVVGSRPTGCMCNLPTQTVLFHLCIVFVLSVPS